jgi:hypothetical protein
VAGQSSDPRSQALLEGLEVRLAFFVDGDDLAVEQDRGREAAERAGDRPEQVRE